MAWRNLHLLIRRRATWNERPRDSVHQQAHGFGVLAKGLSLRRSSNCVFQSLNKQVQPLEFKQRFLYKPRPADKTQPHNYEQVFCIKPPRPMSGPQRSISPVPTINPAPKTKAIIPLRMMALKVFVAALARPPSSWCTAPYSYGANSYDDARYLDRCSGRNGSSVRDGVADHDNAMKIQDQGFQVNQSN
jgi:hypothetical protein